MSLSPLAIATQGLGYSTRLIAVQGLWPFAARVGMGGNGKPPGTTRRGARRTFLKASPEDLFLRRDAQAAAAKTLNAINRGELREITSATERSWRELLSRVRPGTEVPTFVSLPGDDARRQQAKNRLRAIVLICLLLLQ